MALRPIGGARRNAAIRTETDTAKADRQAMRDIRQSLKPIVDGWDTATNAQKFAGTKDAIQAIRQLIIVLV